MWEKDPGAIHRQKLVTIVQAELNNGTLADKITWKTLVLIPKGDGGDFQGIGLVEVICKTVTGLLNRRFALANQVP